MATTVHEPPQIERRLPELGGSGNGGRNLPPSGGRLRGVRDFSPPPSSTALWVGLAAITMTFIAFTSALIVRQGASMDWRHINLPRVLYLNTVVLLASSVTFEVFRRSFQKKRDALDPGTLSHSQRSAAWLYATLLLGISFVVGQYVAWLRLSADGFYLATNPSSSFFYVLTAAHALHVLGGIGGLLYVIRRFGQSQLRPTALGVASRYWHFVDILWLYLLWLLWAKL